MRTPEPHLLRRTAQAATAVRDAGLTDAFSLDEPVAIRLEGEDVPWYAALYGIPEDDEGVHFAKGALGLRHLRDLADRVRSDRECERGVELLDVGFVLLHALAPAKRGALQKAGVFPRTGEPVPDFTAKDRNGGRTAPDARDLRRLDRLLRALLALEDHQDADLPPGTLLTVTVAPTGTEVTAEVHHDDLGRAEAPVRCSDEAAAWPILDAEWVLGIGVRPPITWDARERRLLFILDAADGSAVKLTGAGREDPLSLAREFLRGLWLEELEPGFARSMIVLDEELARHLEPVLGPRGVRVQVATSHPAMAVAEARLRRQVERHGDEDNVETWRSLAAVLDQEVGRRFEAETDVSACFRAFFGPWVPDVEDDADETVLRSALTTMTEWAALCMRRSPRAPTVVERILRGDLDERSRALLTAHADAAPSLFVVRGTDPEAETLELEDVFTGERVTANDRSLSGSAKPDLVIPLRIVPAGPFRMLWLAGPHFMAGEIPEALAEFERWGVAPTPEGLAARPEVLGRLWTWRWEKRKRPVTPKVVNADGDEVILQEAVYRIVDGNAARAALRKRAELDYAEREDTFTWWRPTRPGEEAWGDNVILAHLRFIGDELIAEVNSERRLQRLRAWLDRVPGIEFQQVRASTLAAARARERPLDDRLPAMEPRAETPEAPAALGELLEKQWRAWPDTPLPMLGGKTPRQACAMPAGRAKVAALVRTFTSPHPAYDIVPVRARLLESLGLDRPPGA